MVIKEKTWKQIEPHIPKTYSRGRPRENDKEVLEGIVWVLQTGARWKDLPKEYPSASTCHDRFQEWNKAGVWRNIIETLSSHLDLEESAIDATFVPAKKGGQTSGKQNKEKEPK